MRFVLALVAFVVAAGLLVLGVGQRTFLLPAERLTTALSVPADAHYVVVPGSALNAHSGLQHLRISGPGTVFAAYGRSSDVTAWLSGERYVEAGVGTDGRTAATRVRTAPVVAGLTGAARPDPDGSDLWLDQHRATGALDWTMRLPSDVSLLIAADGKTPAPSTISLSWPQRSTAPLSTPLIVAGAVLAIVGLLLYIWALVQVRRRRGPRRTPPPRMPKPPQPARFKPARVATPSASRGRRSVHQMLAGTGVVAAASLVLAGCAGTPAGGVTASATQAPSSLTQVPVTQTQAARIVGAAASAAASADAKLDPTLLMGRFTGPALDLRWAAYKIRKRYKKAQLPEALPTRSRVLDVTLPEATTGWPRTLFTVVQGGSATTTKQPSLALTLVQRSPRDPYRVQYAISLEPGSKRPNLPVASVGAPRLRPDTDLLTVAPAALAADYGLLLRKGGVPVATRFDVTHDRLLAAVGAVAKKKAAKALGSTAKVSFSDKGTDPSSVVALGTADSGALVSVGLVEQQTVKPVKSGVRIGTSGAVKALSKVGSTAKGIRSLYGYQLLFSVPPAGSSDRVLLLGYAQGLISAKEL